MNIEIIREKADFQKLWTKYFDDYITSLAKHSSEIDVEYFLSSEHKDVVASYAQREKNPIRTVYLRDEVIKGFAIYQLLDEGVYVLEYTVLNDFRNSGLGSKFYNMIEESLKTDGHNQIELTPTNEMNLLFWQKQGFVKTSTKDEDGKFIYKKTI